MLRSVSLALFVLASIPASAQDLVFALDFNNSGGFNTACLNDGAGAFACALVTDNTDRRRSRDVAVADFDADGDDDMVFATSGTDNIPATNRLCRAGGGAFACSDVSADLSASEGVAAADLDGDGDTDLAFANSAVSGGGAANRVCLNDGAAVFTCADVSADANESRGVVATDLDGDGDADLAFANTVIGGAGAIDRRCLNDGAAGFTCTDISADVGSSTDIGTTDANGDGAIDLVVTNFFGADKLCLNDGAAGFTCASISTDTGDTHGVASGDLDGDGDLDLAFANPITNQSSRTNRVCLNDGAGVYTCAPESTDTDQSQDVVAVDTDGDGDLDLVFATEAFFTFGGGRGINRLCVNDGSAGFTCEDIQPQRNDAFGVAVGDFGGTSTAGEDAPADGFALTLAPNPARAAATVRYTLAEPGWVTLTVHDRLGRTVARLADGAASPGSHTMRLDTGDLAAGVYVVRLTTPRVIGVQRFTVVR